MSNRRQKDRYYQQQDDIDNLAGCLGMAMFFAIAGSIAAIFESKKIPPENELQGLKSKHYWGHPLAPTTCPSCQALNEPNQSFCFSCGESFVKEAPPTPIDTRPDHQQNTPGEILILAVFLIIVALMILSALSDYLANLF